MSIRSEEVIPPTLIPGGCRNCGGPCYLHTTDSTGMHQVKCGRGLDAACGYCGPFSSRKDEAIHLHNLLCAPAVQATADAEEAAKEIWELFEQRVANDLWGGDDWPSEEEISEIIRKAASPKAAQEPRAWMRAKDHALRSGSIKPNEPGFWYPLGIIPTDEDEPLFPPAPSVGEQEKEL